MEQKYSEKEMLHVGATVINTLDHWNLQGEEIINILGVPEIKPRHLARYRACEKALPQTDDVMKRLEHVVGIADALRTTYPMNKGMRVRWLHQRHHRFRRKTPLSVMLEEGINGLVKVRIELDCSYGWAIGDAMYAAQKAASR